MGHTGQVEGVGVGQSHAFVVVLSVLWLDDVPISVHVYVYKPQANIQSLGF